VVLILAKNTKKLENGVAIRHLLTQGVDLVCHALHLAVAVGDAKTTLFERMKLFIKLKGTSLMVAKELSIDNKPRLSNPNPATRQRGC
jgi:hypothetical protein